MFSHPTTRIQKDAPCDHEAEGAGMARLTFYEATRLAERVSAVLQMWEGYAPLITASHAWPMLSLDIQCGKAN